MVNGSVTRIALSPEIDALRLEALRRQSETKWVPTMPLIDAESWREHTPDEDWLIWRGRRTRNRLARMPIEILPCERIVGRPRLGDPTPNECLEIEGVRAVLESIPPYPGGDAGHFHPDYEKAFRIGIGGILQEIRSRRESATADQSAFYDACELAMSGLSEYALRVADACESAGDTPELRELARICRRLSTEPPATFHEAIELMFLVTIGLWFGEEHMLTTPGRMDQTLRPFYEADLAAGRITRREAFELICGLYIQLNMILFPGSAVSVIVGGRDQDAHDITNDLTYLCLEARLATHLVYPTVGIAWHEGTPSELTDFACRMLATGIGDPAFFNDEVIAAGLRDHGVSAQDSHNYMNSTCVEIKVVGASNMWVTAPYFNCPQALLDVIDGVVSGSLPNPSSFDELSDLVKSNLAATVRNAAQDLDRVWRQRAQTGCFPLASCFISDCLADGLDYDRGGARYNWVENSFVGLANLADGMFAIKRLVYESGELGLADIHAALKADFDGHEMLQRRILEGIPKYGTDSDGVDALAAEWAEFLQTTTESNTIGGHRYVPGFFCWIMHEHFGSQTAATPDGRKSGLPLADGAGAAQGREKSGPTAAILSTTKWSHQRVLGGLVQNIKLSSSALSDERGIAALRSLIETYLRRGGFEIQVNVVSADTLRDAQARPSEYADLVVRVAGYSDYFVHLSPKMQGEIIARTEHGF